MIDIHTHILPNIDDGATSIEETVKLINEAKEAGFETIVLTPHYKKGYFETDLLEREVWVDAIYENFKNRNIEIKICLGNEIYLSDDMIKYMEERKSINNE